MVTDYMSVLYDEDKLTKEEICELENFCFRMYMQLENKILEMGLIWVEDCYGNILTKINKETFMIGEK